MVTEELYGSLFYLFMRNDVSFMNSFDNYAFKYKFLVPDLSAEFGLLE